MAKFTAERPDPEAAARQLVQLAASIEAVQDGAYTLRESTRRFSTP
ncbi:hypothetical protein [Bradyrhizobium sp. CCGB12]|nr:hypothetical protein [Bradyrhizobium sp. CCGB12]